MPKAKKMKTPRASEAVVYRDAFTGKAAEHSRTPRRFALSLGCRNSDRSWSAAVLYRFHLMPDREVFLILLLLSSFPVCGLAAESAAPGRAKTFDVREFGAKGDGKALDTSAIQKAIDQCGESGGAIVRFAPGTYLSKPIFLRSRTTLQLEAGATLMATDEPDDFSRTEQQDLPTAAGKFLAFINGTDLRDIAIVGKGEIDGAGGRWWLPAEEARRKTPGYTLPRPRMILLVRCKNVELRGVTLANSPSFHLVPNDCEDVLIDGVTIKAPAGSPNTDAIDPSVSRRVRITRCVIDVGDDNVAIKSGKKMQGRDFGCEDITITDCVFRHGHGMSIGSETVGGVRNVTVRNCTFENTENGIRIKSPRGRGGTVENVVCENITMTNVDPAITITCYYPKIPVEDAAQPMTPETPIFRNLRIKNLTAT
ncbi:MAG TPA: glycoside hydrolase family 28 protein, partial [Pyrinomonadaceae bacterium]|nr:glycoside hydrolase family 28 protein [Pyrinomonadaceae bacterium]